MREPIVHQENEEGKTKQRAYEQVLSRMQVRISLINKLPEELLKAQEEYVQELIEVSKPRFLYEIFSR